MNRGKTTLLALLLVGGCTGTEAGSAGGGGPERVEAWQTIESYKIDERVNIQRAGGWLRQPGNEGKSMAEAEAALGTAGAGPWAGHGRGDADCQGQSHGRPGLPGAALRLLPTPIRRRFRTPGVRGHRLRSARRALRQRPAAQSNAPGADPLRRRARGGAGRQRRRQERPPGPPRAWRVLVRHGAIDGCRRPAVLTS